MSGLQSIMMSNGLGIHIRSMRTMQEIEDNISTLEQSVGGDVSRLDSRQQRRLAQYDSEREMLVESQHAMSRLLQLQVNAANLDASGEVHGAAEENSEYQEEENPNGEP
jgi:hypothetical protein